MIKSMTAYATAECSVNQCVVSTEIRSYNSRFVDILLRLPTCYQSLEDKIKERFTGRVTRGRVEMKLAVEKNVGDAQRFEIDQSKARSVFTALNHLRHELNLQSDISLELLLSVGGILKPVELSNDCETLWPAIRDCLDQAIAELDRMRAREGDFIAQDLDKRLAYIGDQLEKIRTQAGGLLASYHQRLRERMLILVRDIVEIDFARIAQEAAILADRSDITEEILRAESHLKQFRQIMESEEPAGRKLNFLVQELHREFTTMGAKIGNAEGSHIIIEVKSELEKIREQLQNVE